MDPDLTEENNMGFVFRMRNGVMRYSRILKRPSVSSKEQQKIIDSLPEPKDIVDRAYNQYKTTMAGWTLFGSFFAEAVSFFLLPIYVWLLRRQSVEFEEPFNLICLVSPDQKNIIPLTLKKEFGNIRYGDVSERMCIDKEDWMYLSLIYKRYKRGYYFKLKILFRIATYSAFIKQYHAKAFVSAAEHSFSNTICTDYCEHKKIENIVCQHGEYLKQLSGSFFYVHRYYAWDEYYIKLHLEHRAFIPQFEIYLPDAIAHLEIDLEKSPTYYATYYLAYENKEELENIRKNFDLLKEKGKRCKLRLHPRGRVYNEKIVKNIFGLNYYVEDCSKIALGDSISDSEYLMAIHSTVLLQGYLNGKKIIINDITQKAMYKELQDLGYIMLSKPHFLLSDIIAENH